MITSNNTNNTTIHFGYFTNHETKETAFVVAEFEGSGIDVITRSHTKISSIPYGQQFLSIITNLVRNVETTQLTLITSQPDLEKVYCKLNRLYLNMITKDISRDGIESMVIVDGRYKRLQIDQYYIDALTSIWDARRRIAGFTMSHSTIKSAKTFRLFKEAQAAVINHLPVLKNEVKKKVAVLKTNVIAFPQKYLFG